MGVQGLRRTWSPPEVPPKARNLLRPGPEGSRRRRAIAKRLRILLEPPHVPPIRASLATARSQQIEAMIEIDQASHLLRVLQENLGGAVGEVIALEAARQLEDLRHFGLASPTLFVGL